MRLIMLESFLEQLLSWLLVGLFLVWCVRVAMQCFGISTDVLDTLLAGIFEILWKPAISLIGLYLLLLSRYLIFQLIVSQIPLLN